MLKRNLLLFFVAIASYSYAQQSTLTVEKIMRDPKWMGVSPDRIFWDYNGTALYFNWNPELEDRASTYSITTTETTPKRVGDERTRTIVSSGQYDKSKSKYVFERGGDIYLIDVNSGAEKRLTHTLQVERSPRFNASGDKVIFQQGDNLFAWSLGNSQLTQLTNISRDSGRPEGRARSSSEQNKWLETDQLDLFDVLNENKKQDSIRRAAREALTPEEKLKEIKLAANESLMGLQLSPDERYITYRISKRPDGNQNTIVPSYVTESGYTEDIAARTKVGNALPTTSLYIFDTQRDTIIPVMTSAIPGIKDLPGFWDDYPEKKAALLKADKDRQVTLGEPIWNESGSAAVVNITAADNKDRWLMRLEASDGSLHLIDRQRDEAWIGGPGVGGWGGGNLGWLDEETIYFQSEASGYSHVYTANVRNGSKKQLTSGKYEVRSLQLSNDKKQFYFTANIEHPGITHFYRIPVGGGSPTQITGMKGGNEVTLSPDEKWLAIRYSYSNKPWELYLQENKPGAEAVQITNSTTDEFQAYAWKEPEMIQFKNRHGDDIYARLYQPQNPKASKPAVIFVHGAGYLQNVHYWWSQYFREYMFHNLLVDLGYTVLDIDFTASSGYGRDHRTGIYRHMGGKDLSDQVDGAKLLVEQYGVNPKNIGLYGGSYGGFITLMAMFNEPGVFAAGAGLRSVTDWAHYNHGYTANILNTPVDDPIAYKRSSPIYFAEGLQGHLLMAHGMIDVNVHYQDIIRLTQRLIELGKDNWELASYPLEDHGFVHPSSWADEYKRILKLFEERLVN